MKMNAPALLLLALVALPAMALADGIEDVCNKTPYPNLCTSTIRADPRSKSAGAPQMGLIVVDKVESTVKVADEKAKQAARSTTDPDLKSALGNCGTYYNAILTGDVVASKESFTKGDYKYAVDYMTDASTSLGTCEKWFQAGKSPVTAENISGKQLSDIAVAIGRLLL